MYKFDENNIATGFIKQLLKDFNLPSCKTYVPNENIILPNTYYINKFELVKTKSSIPQSTILDESMVEYKEPYEFGKKINLFTKNLMINSINYDSKTHEYLGNYLRFLRDYKEINLMPLYNCFSKNIVDNLELEKVVNGKKVYFNSYDNMHKIYSIPVKFGKKYTIAIDCGTKVEMICGMYSNAIVDGNFEDVYKETYVSYQTLNFGSPIIFDSLTKSKFNDIMYHKFENCLRLFIKLPYNNDSSIVVLEGDYSGEKYQQMTNGSLATFICPAEVINYDRRYEFPTRLSLLKMNDKEQHPFANRLVEYLSGMTITFDDDFGGNIKRVQNQLISSLQYNKNKVKLPYIDYYGVWGDNLRNICWEATNKRIVGKNVEQSVEKPIYYINTVYDILGYVDKDVEKIITVEEE